MEYEILKRKETAGDEGTKSGAWILVKRDHDVHPFVTAWKGDVDTSWCWGNYFADIDEATKDFQSRAGIKIDMDSYMDKFDKVIDVVIEDEIFAEWYNAHGVAYCKNIVRLTMESHPIDFDRILKLLDPSSDLRPMTIANVMHDFTGLVRYFNFQTEKLTHAFMPRFAKLEHHWVDEHIVG